MMTHAPALKTSSLLKFALCTLVAATTFAPAHADVTINGASGNAPVPPTRYYPCFKLWLKQHRQLACFLAVVSTLALAAQPTTGEYELSQELLLKDPIKYLRNAFGWFHKETKIDYIDSETCCPVYKEGWKGKGLMGLIEKYSKKLAPLAGLMVLVKAVDPYCDTMTLVLPVEFTQKQG